MVRWFNAAPMGSRQQRMRLAAHKMTDQADKRGQFPFSLPPPTLGERRHGILRETILVACCKCDWRAAFSRDDLIASHGANYPIPNLLNHLAAPSCSRLGSNWDRCGVHYVEPIEGAR